MSKKLDLAGSIALAATFAFALLSSDGSFAAAKAPAPVKAEIALPQAVANNGIDAQADGQNQASLSSDATTNGSTSDGAVVAPAGDEPSAVSLAELVAQRASNAPLSRELNCLASAIYFESKSEPLAGQLAVGRVIVARSRSGRFPDSYCGVVYQPSQFSFVRGNAMPSINKDSRFWKNAVAIAQISHEGSWQSPVEGALYFHSARVSPRWGKERAAKIGNQVFYR